MSQPELRSRPSKLSLFNLFSKPKVEIARGHVEAGFTSQPALPSKTPPSSTGDERSVATAPSQRYDRVKSPLPFRATDARPTSRAAPQSSPPSRHEQPSPVAWNPPPLFLAYAQSVRHGLLDVATLPPPDTVLQKARAPGTGGVLLDPTAAQAAGRDNASVQTRRTVKLAKKYGPNAAVSPSATTKKVLVLIKSGYVLQYADKGPSDRLPEKVLQLRKDSAAFASDLIPGQHYVLQISQAAEQQGDLLPPSTSLFVKLGLRRQEASNVATRFLLILPDAATMGAWMMAIREEILIVGGLKVRSDSTERPDSKAGEALSSRVEASPSRTRRSLSSSNGARVSLPESASPRKLISPARDPSKDGEEDAISAIETIDQADNGAQKPAQQPAEEEGLQGCATEKPEVDTQSVASFSKPSLDERRLNSLRSSERISHSTLATTTTGSSANSLNSSPEPAKRSSETSGEGGQNGVSYRTLSSYSSGSSRRRSVMPLSTQRVRSNTSNQAPLQSPFALPMESPVIGRNTPWPTPSRASPQKLAVVSSEPNLRAVAAARVKRESRPLPSQETTAEPVERPVSVVGELPSPPSAAAADKSPKKRNSEVQLAVPPSNERRQGAVRYSLQPRTTSKRATSQHFSLPLRINPSTPENRPPTRQEDRGSFNEVEESKGEPMVHTLTAKVDASETPHSSGRTGEFAGPTSLSPTSRLSLFPSPAVSPNPTNGPRKLSLSASPPASEAQNHVSEGRSLRRPASLQVRSDPAPFLQGVRVPTANSTVVSTGGQQRSFTAPPIRSLKPSRSAVALSSMTSMPMNSPTDPFSRPPSSTPIMAGQHRIAEEAEAEDEAGPLRVASPPPPRAGGRKLKTRSSLPELDLGLPVVGLGPPAPPPNVPLPLPPPPGSRSRAASPMPPGTGLGIRV